jgi:hypothetical protein
MSTFALPLLIAEWKMQQQIISSVKQKSVE